jgi:hypothetical protein
MMVFWGLGVAIVTTLVLFVVAPTVWPMSDGRDVALRASMVALGHGSPLLVGGSPGHFYSLGTHDDDGIYVYIPVLSRLLGVADPLRMMRDFYIALSFLGIALYPTIFYRLTGSVLAGLASPLMFIVCLVSMAMSDIYWIPAWGALTLLPLVFFLLRDWPRYGLVLAAGITLVASVISSIRSYSGLGIAVAVGIALLLRRWRWWRVLAVLTTLACIYASIDMFVIGPIQADRDHWLGRGTALASTSHNVAHRVRGPRISPQSVRSALRRHRPG